MRSGHAPSADFAEKAEKALAKLIRTGVWRQEGTLEILKNRDVGAMFVLLQRHGVSQRAIAYLAGCQQSEVSEIIGGRRVTSYDILVRIAEGLRVPRGLLGLAHTWDGPDPATRPEATTARPVRVNRRGLRTHRYPDNRANVVVTEGPPLDALVITWTGVEVAALRQAKRMTPRSFGKYLDISSRMLSRWEARGMTTCPSPANQSILDSALALAPESVKRRFVLMIAETEVAVVALTTDGDSPHDTAKPGGNDKRTDHVAVRKRIDG